jgi:hypothetical protein
MFLHPDLTMAQFNAHHRELIAEADRRRLLSADRQWRRHARAEARAGAGPTVRGRPAATLTPCEPSAAA